MVMVMILCVSSFLLTPLREGRPNWGLTAKPRWKFLLTPLREGRRDTAENSH